MGINIAAVILLAILLLVATFSIGCLPFYYININSTYSNTQNGFLKVFSQFGVGMLLGTAFMLVIPEGIKARTEEGGNVGFDLLAGFIGVYLFDRLGHSIMSNTNAFLIQNPEESNDLPTSSAFRSNLNYSIKEILTKPRVVVARVLKNNVILAFVIHGISDGVALGTTSNNQRLLIVVFIAITIHKIPAVLSLSALMLTKQGLPMTECMTNLFAFSLSTPVGYILLSLLNLRQSATMDYISSNLLLMSGGSLLYASFTAFSEDDHFIEQTSDPSTFVNDEYNAASNDTEAISVDVLEQNSKTSYFLKYDESLYILVGAFIPTLISFMVKDD